MSRIKGKNTKPEMIVRKFLHSEGFRYSLHDKRLPGKPDIVLTKYKSIVDVRGCFWHNHVNCKYGDEVKTTSSQVSKKRNSAIERDRSNLKLWKSLGWQVLVIWSDCELEPRRKKSQKRIETLTNILEKLNNANPNN